MKRIIDWISHHQVAAFFIITFAISWGLGFTWDAVMNRGTIILAPLTSVSICSPALAGIIISAISNTRPREGSGKIPTIAFLVAWAVTALVFLAHNTFVNLAPFSLILLVFTLVLVLPVAFVISMAYSHIPEVKSYLSSLVRLRGVLGWAILAMILAPALILLSIPISDLLGRRPIASHEFSDTGLVLVGLIGLKFLYQFFFFNATGEEAGWRGFALPRIQSFSSPLIACLILNLFWGLWHLFPWFAEGRPVFSAVYWARTYVELLPGTVILVWFYNHSKGSILVAGTAHAAANTAYVYFPNLDWLVFNWVVGVAALAIIFFDRMWKKLPSDHSAVYRSPEHAVQPNVETIPGLAS